MFFPSNMVGLEMVLFCAEGTWGLTPSSSQVPTQLCAHFSFASGVESGLRRVKFNR